MTANPKENKMANFSTSSPALSSDERRCDGCTLCCTLVPVASLGKPAGRRCQHQRSALDLKGAGCAVYHAAGFPGECGLWSCRWLINDDMDDMLRPDRAHYVVDIVPDYVTAQNPGKSDAHVSIVQIWVDPNWPDAHKDFGLRRWIIRQEKYAALVRYNEKDAILLIPPHMSDTGQWEEIDNRAPRSNMTMELTTHSGEQIAAKLFEAGIER